jgi:hypothetical protein
VLPVSLNCPFLIALSVFSNRPWAKTNRASFYADFVNKLLLQKYLNNHTTSQKAHTITKIAGIWGFTVMYLRTTDVIVG